MTDDMKRLWIFDPLTLTVDAKIDLSSIFKLQNKSCLTINPWIKGRMVIFDQVTGNGVVFNQRKLILKFKEHIDWTYAVGIDTCRSELQAIVAGYHENRQIRYDIIKRKVIIRGIKEYDLAHNAVILSSPDAMACLIFESSLSTPVARLYIDSEHRDDIKISGMSQSKFTRLFKLQAGIVACTTSNTVVVMTVREMQVKVVKVFDVLSSDDDTSIEHVEALNRDYLIVCTRRAFYRLTI